MCGEGFFRRAHRLKILHTSDWHLGKRLMDRERLPEQVEVLDELVSICEKEGVDLVLVAGDVFDTYLPPAEAEEVFFRAVKQLAKDGRAVVIVSGNHDDGMRLAAAAPLAGEEGVYLFGGRTTNIPIGSDRRVHAVSASEHHILIENEHGERVFINALPYPNEARLKEEKTEETFSERMRRWIARGEAEYDGDAAYVLLSHLFVAGGRTSESERDIDLGGARAVPLACMPETGYVALGHLHKPQRLGKTVYYSGSLLQYSFDEANTEKSINLLTVHGRDIEVRSIPLKAGKRLVRLQSTGVEEALRLLPMYPDCYIELTLKLTAPLTSEETESLRSANPGLVSLITQVDAGETVKFVSRSAMKPAELFGEYYKSQFGEVPPDELKEAFLTLLEEGQ